MKIVWISISYIECEIKSIGKSNCGLFIGDLGRGKGWDWPQIQIATINIHRTNWIFAAFVCACVRAFVCCVCVWLFETAPHQPIFQSSSNMDKDGNIGMEPSTETVYGTHDDNTMVMSEKVIFKCTIQNENGKTISILPNARNAQSYWPVCYQLVVQSVMFFL